MRAGKPHRHSLSPLKMPFRTTFVAACLCRAVLFPAPASAVPAVSAINGHEFFVVKTPDGREEMRISCDEEPKQCVLRATLFVVPDPTLPTQFADWSKRLAAGNDSLRNSLCQGLHLIEPAVPESREIVALLKEACARSDSRRLSLAYAKMDSLSRNTCILINREEYLKFAAQGDGSWSYRVRKPNACLDEKTYVIRADPASRGKSLEKIFRYSDSPATACAEEKGIDADGTLRQSTDGHIGIPARCHYLYLQ